MTFLFLNQTFYPDVMATGQYLADAATALAERGHQVTVLASRRAYDNPKTVFSRTETWRGVRIIRVSSTGFGKAAKWRRAVDFASFLFLACVRLLFLPRYDAIVALTSPPLISFLGAFFSKLRGSRFHYWVMDFNPDEAIAAGWLRVNSPVTKLLDWASRFSLRNADKLVALDRFMRDRIVAKGISADKILILPPWSQETHISFDPAGRERFRKLHGLDGKFVVMYSGNHSPCHSLATLLKAAERLAMDSEIAFLFVGGGSEWRKLKASTDQVKRNAAEAPAGNLLCLPYQPFSDLSASLSAADLHVVVMGDAFLGLVHPCKIYNILTVGSPVLYIGPEPSHVTEILGPALPNAIAARNSSISVGLARHGDIDSVMNIIRRMQAGSASIDRAAMKELCIPYTRQALLPELIAALENGLEASLTSTTQTRLSRINVGLR